MQIRINTSPFVDGDDPVVIAAVHWFASQHPELAPPTHAYRIGPDTVRLMAPAWNATHVYEIEEKPMSFSFGASGSIPAVRKTLANVYEMPTVEGNDSRAAKRAIEAEVDKLLVAGATHVTVSASGHGGHIDVNVQRDLTAEAQAKADEYARERAAWEQHGVAKGFATSAEDLAQTITVRQPDSAERVNKPSTDQCAKAEDAHIRRKTS